ncbi:hypothetical protein JTE90_021923 [Oedothorax gibbosus]|uniref:Uncharacterized protein n=1 Tax=Oedothorax gibbosus TaxID=931172 RepID=A0AAV6VUU1_9ARAC|nr:hypothetical protein JTE90_021923 [Oedothorax gibbosus]
MHTQLSKKSRSDWLLRMHGGLNPIHIRAQFGDPMLRLQGTPLQLKIIGDSIEPAIVIDWIRSYACDLLVVGAQPNNAVNNANGLVMIIGDCIDPAFIIDWIRSYACDLPVVGAQPNNAVNNANGMVMVGRKAWFASQRRWNSIESFDLLKNLVACSV